MHILTNPVNLIYSLITQQAVYRWVLNEKQNRMFNLSNIRTHTWWCFLQLQYLFTSPPASRIIGWLTATFAVSFLGQFSWALDYQNEAPLVEQLLDVSRPGHKSLDVGSNVSTYFCYAWQRVASVVAIEFRSGSTVCAQENLILCRISIIVVERALGGLLVLDVLRPLSNSTVEVDFCAPTLPQSFHSVGFSHVDAVLDDLPVIKPGITPPNILKMDAARVEIQVFQEFCDGISNARLEATNLRPETLVDPFEFADFDVDILRNRYNEVRILPRL